MAIIPHSKSYVQQSGHSYLTQLTEYTPTAICSGGVWMHDEFYAVNPTAYSLFLFSLL
jgi:hypothetical protein